MTGRIARRLPGPGLRGTIAVVSVIALYFAVNLVALKALEGWRLDLTEGRLYTLAPATRAVLERIDEPITLTLFLSRSLERDQPALAAYASRVRELLAEYAERAGGRLVLRLRDPAPFSPAEDEALAFGLTGLPLANGDTGYFGLTGTNAVDDQAVIPLFAPRREPELEYDLTAVIAALAEPERTTVGVLSPLPLAGDAEHALWLITLRLAEFFRLTVLLTDAIAIDPSIDVLLLAHPRGLGPATLYAVDQYLMGGGRVLAFVDPYSEIERALVPPSARFAPNGSDLAPFADSWGIRLRPDRAAADIRLAIPVEVPGDRPETVDDALLLSVRRPFVSRDDAIASELNAVTFASAGILDPVDGAGTTMTPLLTTSGEAMALPLGHVQAEIGPRQLLALYRAGPGPLTLAARIRGPARSAFADGPPAGAATGAAHLAATTAPLDIVVVADSDFLADPLWARVSEVDGQPVATTIANNDAFVINAIEALRGAVNLATLRGRADVARPFERIAALQAEADAQYRTAEQGLLRELTETEAALAELERTVEGEAALTAARREALGGLRARIIEIRRELRTVQRALRQEVESLQLWLQFAATLMVPALLAAAALAWAGLRRRTAARAGNG
ncbi:MAG: Gldg family protein [Rhodospirillaceae bacterium]|nr:Gldg family protein [Rhodospirillaceae bacterium]